MGFKDCFSVHLTKYNFTIQYIFTERKITDRSNYYQEFFSGGGGDGGLGLGLGLGIIGILRYLILVYVIV